MGNHRLIREDFALVTAEGHVLQFKAEMQCVARVPFDNPLFFPPRWALPLTWMACSSVTKGTSLPAEGNGSPFTSLLWTLRFLLLANSHGQIVFVGPQVGSPPTARGRVHREHCSRSHTTRTTHTTLTHTVPTSVACSLARGLPQDNQRVQISTSFHGAASFAFAPGKGSVVALAHFSDGTSG